MKKLAVLFAVAVIVCFAASALKAQDTVTPQGNMAECNLFFGQVIDSTPSLNKDIFEDQVEDILYAGFFWANCIEPQLKNGKDVNIKYIYYTANAKPTEKEIKHIIKSATVFKDELEDYIEDQEPKKSTLHNAERYTFLKVQNLNLNKRQTLILKHANAKFRNDWKSGKIHIHIMTEQNQQK